MKKANAVQPEAAEETTAIATIQSTVALAESEGIDLAEDAANLEQEFSKDDFSIPFLRVLQTNSPEATEGDPEYIEGAKPGYVLITSTGEVFDTIKGSLILILATYRRTFIEWVLRDSGGGFVKDHGLIEGGELLKRCTDGPKGERIVPGTDNKHQLVETMQYLALYQDNNGNFKPAMMPLTSTQLKKGRMLNSAIDGLRINVKGKEVKPPMFYQAFSLSTVREENDKGKWFGMKFESHAPVLELKGGVEAYKAARALREQVLAGEIKLENAAEAEAKAGGDTAQGDDSAF